MNSIHNYAKKKLLKMEKDPRDFLLRSLSKRGKKPQKAPIRPFKYKGNQSKKLLFVGGSLQLVKRDS